MGAGKQKLDADSEIDLAHLVAAEREAALRLGTAQTLSADLPDQATLACAIRGRVAQLRLQPRVW